MPLIVKIMTDDGLADDSPYKAHSLTTGVISLKFLLASESNSSKPCVLMYFGAGEEPEYADIAGNVYVMNENGKTISSWAAPVEVPKHEKKGTVEVLMNGARFSLLDRPYKGYELYRELGVSELSELQIEEFNTSDSVGEWTVVLLDKRYYPGEGARFREAGKRTIGSSESR